MTRAEKKTPRPHLHTVKPASASPAEDGTIEPAAATPGAKAKSEEVSAARRRTFTAEFKRQMVAEAEACMEPGEVGALLRRRGLSHA